VSRIARTVIGRLLEKPFPSFCRGGFGLRSITRFNQQFGADLVRAPLGAGVCARALQAAADVARVSCPVFYQQMMNEIGRARKPRN
jgi:hypothetical protein